MSKPKISDAEGQAALDLALAGDNSKVAFAVRFSLQKLSEIAPGRSVEVRVPPFAAAQCIAGPIHRRGTPANVIECPPDVWLNLATGAIEWQVAMESGKLLASGSRVHEVSKLLPLFN